MIPSMRAILPALVVASVLAWPGPSRAEQHAYKIFVDGLACPFCAYGVEKNILGLKEVKTMDIDINGGFIIVVMEDGKTLDEETAKAAVADAGFTLRAFEAPKGGK